MNPENENVEVTEEVQELEINRRNRENYEQLMKDSSTQLDGYWDKDNLFVKLLLFGLFAIIVVGSIIVFSAYFAGN